MRPEPDVDSRSRRKPRSGRGLLRGATPRRFLGGGSSRSAHTRKRARSRGTIAMPSRLFPCRTSLTAVSHRAPGPLLEPEMLRPARDQGACDGCPMAARPRHRRCALDERTNSRHSKKDAIDPLRTSGVSATAAYPLADRREWIFLQSSHAVRSAETPLILWRARHTRRQS